MRIKGGVKLCYAISHVLLGARCEPTFQCVSGPVYIRDCITKGKNDVNAGVMSFPWHDGVL